MIPVDAMSNPGRHGMRNGGAFELRWLSWVLSLGNATGGGLTPDGREAKAAFNEKRKPRFTGQYPGTSAGEER